MGTLTTFLEKEANRLNRQKENRQRLVDDWRASVTALLDWVESVARRADTQQVLLLRRGELTRSERQLGVYSAPYLTITLDLRIVHLVPLARFVGNTIRLDGGEQRLASTGCVMVKNGPDPTDPANVFALYRSPPFVPGEGYRMFEFESADTYVGEDHWFVRSPGEDPSVPDRRLTEEGLERILVGTLQ